MNNRIGKLVKDIQYATDFTIEQIADKIDYSRAHLTRLAKHGDSQKAYDALMKEFKEITQKVKNTPVVSLAAQGGQNSQQTSKDTDTLTTVTTKPDFGIKSNGKELTILQAEALKDNAATLKSQQELISDLAKNVMHLSGKLIEKR